MEGARISAVVMTLNEERNIAYCLRSIRPWCDEVIVVDMLSEDRTVELATRYADEVVTHERVLGFDAGRQKGLDRATGDWILSIDADEVVAPQLARWIRNFVNSNPPFDLALIPRANVFLGQWLRSTRWWPGKPRLFRRGAVEVTEILHHGLLPRQGVRVAYVPKDPDHSMWHFTRQSLTILTEKTNHYTSIEARQQIAAGRPDPRGHEPFLAGLRSLAKYVVRGVHRDGMAGLAYAMDRAYYKWLVQMKRWDERRAPSRQEAYDRWREDILAGYADWDAATETFEAVPVARNGGNGGNGSKSPVRPFKRPLKRLAKRLVGTSRPR